MTTTTCALKHEQMLFLNSQGMQTEPRVWPIVHLSGALPQAAAAVCNLRGNKRASSRLDWRDKQLESPTDGLVTTELTLGFAEVQGMVRHWHPESLSGVDVSPRVVVALGVLLFGGGGRIEEEKKRSHSEHTEKPLLLVRVEDWLHWAVSRRARSHWLAATRCSGTSSGRIRGETSSSFSSSAKFRCSWQLYCCTTAIFWNKSKYPDPYSIAANAV